MSETAELNSPIHNRLLAALPVKEYRRMFFKLEQIALTYGENIYKQGEIIRHVYFPESGGFKEICVNGRNQHLLLMEDFYADYTRSH